MAPAASLYKTDAAGTPLYHFVFTAPHLIAAARQGAVGGRLPSALAYAGPTGRLRASHRALDPERSTELAPYLSHAVEEPVVAGTPVRVELGLWPTGLVVHKGEVLVLEIGGPLASPVLPPRAGNGDMSVTLTTRNKGRHTIRTGGAFDSRLLLPRI